jgi:hypothetical protein
LFGRHALLGHPQHLQTIADTIRDSSLRSHQQHRLCYTLSPNVMWSQKAAARLLCKTCFLMQFIAPCILFAVGAGAYSDADFLTPPDWLAHGLGNSGGVGQGGSIEPIGVIISAQSTVDPFAALTTSTSWDTCFNFISTLQANVQPGQQNPVGQAVGLRHGGCVQFAFGGNHLRAWPQTLPDGSTAYLIAASRESACRSDGGRSRVPPPFPNWHCIDHEGFNRGRDELADDFVASAARKRGRRYTVHTESARLYDGGVGTDAGWGSDVDHVPYDGVVRILTLSVSSYIGVVCGVIVDAKDLLGRRLSCLVLAARFVCWEVSLWDRSFPSELPSASRLTSFDCVGLSCIYTPFAMEGKISHTRVRDHINPTVLNAQLLESEYRRDLVRAADTALVRAKILPIVSSSPGSGSPPCFRQNPRRRLECVQELSPSENPVYL